MRDADVRLRGQAAPVISLAEQPLTGRMLGIAEATGLGDIDNSGVAALLRLLAGLPTGLEEADDAVIDP